MTSRQVLTYVAATAAAVCTVGALSTPAWASSQDARHTASSSVTAKQCHAGKGKVIKTGKTLTCKGGKSDKKTVHG